MNQQAVVQDDITDVFGIQQGVQTDFHSAAILSRLQPIDALNLRQGREFPATHIARAAESTAVEFKHARTMRYLIQAPDRNRTNLKFDGSMDS